MTAPQPSNQLPEEVREIIGTILTDERQLSHPWDCADRIIAALAPYLAPRPPAPVDATERLNLFDAAVLAWKALDGTDKTRFAYEHAVNEIAGCAPVDAEWANKLTADISRVIWQLGVRGDNYHAAIKATRELILSHAPADSASAQLAAITVDRDERKADSERLKAREVTLTDRQCLVQLAFTESGFNYESGEGLPELAKRVAGMASAYRARDNIGMSREEYHKAKDALAQLAAMREERDALPGERDQLVMERDAFHEERDAWQAKFTDLNKSLMAELRDPSGTIWEHAKALQKERDELRADKERLDWLERMEAIVDCHEHQDWQVVYLTGPKLDVHSFKGNSPRSALDSARDKQGEGQP